MEFFKSNKSSDASDIITVYFDGEKVRFGSESVNDNINALDHCYSKSACETACMYASTNVQPCVINGNETPCINSEQSTGSLQKYNRSSTFNSRDKNQSDVSLRRNYSKLNALS